MSLSASAHDIKALILSFHPLVVMETVEEDRARTILLSVAGQTRMPLFEWSVTRGLTRAEDTNAIHRMTSTPLSVVQHLGGLNVEGIFLLKDFAKHFEDATLARQFREMTNRFTRTRSAVVLTGASVTLPAEIESAAVRYDLQLPGADELAEVVNQVARSLVKTTRRDILLTPKDREDLLRALRGLTLNQARQAVSQALIENRNLTSQLIQTVLQRKVQAVREGGLLEYYPVEGNRYELGGFANLKDWLARAAVGFTKEARALNLTPPRGILFVGVQGCGKSLAAKVVAKEWQLPLLKLDMGRIYDKYVGESEKNFHKAISLAESVAPTVLWLDEIEKGLGSTAGGDADAGVGRRLFGSFLTWLQEKKQEVFVVATANDLSSLPPELLRKGRFDEIFFVDLPNDEEREAILNIHLKLRKQDPSAFRLEDIVSACQGFSGAEIEQAVIAGLYRALHQKRSLDTGLLLEEITQTVPLSTARREDIERLQETARERFVSVR